MIHIQDSYCLKWWDYFDLFSWLITARLDSKWLWTILCHVFHKKSSSLSAVLVTHFHRTPYLCQNLPPSSPFHNMRWTKIVLDTGFLHMRQDYESLPWSASHAYSNVWLERWRLVLVAPRFENQSLSSTCPTVLKRTLNSGVHHHYSSSSSSSSCLSASCLWFLILSFSIFNVFI